MPAGSRVAIVNFIVLNGKDTGLMATDITARATEIDQAAADIVENFRTDPRYRDGMIQAQLDAVANF